MPVEKSAGAIIFRKKGDKILYLLLEYASRGRTKKSYWDFPRGHIEKGEKIEQAARREIFEETGISNIEFMPNFKHWYKIFFRWKDKTIMKIITYFLAQTKHKQVKLSFEHINHKWLTFNQALNHMKFKESRQALEKAHEFLKEHLDKD